PPSPFPVLQQEQDLVVPPDILVGGAAAPSGRPPLWGSALDGFPPAWPVAAAVTRHCRDPPTLPPPLSLPPTAFAHLRRQAAALDALRPRMSDCCRHHAPLPCARRA
ncbi:ECM1 protein, partial [Xiphorhynchus elegans]|nr:ECM1 protein [Xiphorhynchus elegans]